MDLRFDITPADDPKDGAVLLSLSADDQLEEGSGVRVELFGLGSGILVVNKNHSDVTAANFASGNYVRAYDLDISTTLPFFGFFLDERFFNVLSRDEQGGQVQRYGGPGVMSYLGRVILDSLYYVHFGDDASFGPRVDGHWWWYMDQYGDILKRMIDEAQDSDRPDFDTLIPAVTYDFTSTDDSNGDAWSTFEGSYSLPIGANYLDVVQKLIDAGLFVKMDPEFLLQAFQSGGYGIDRSSAVFADGKVRFVSYAADPDLANIVDTLQRTSRPSLPATRVLVRGDSDDPATMIHRTGSAPVTREIFVSVDGTHAQDILEARGDAELGLRVDASDTPVFKHVAGKSAVEGLYHPFPTAAADIVDYTWTFDDDNYDVTHTYPVGTIPTNWHPGYVHAHILSPAIGNDSASTIPPLSPGTYHFRAIIKGNETYGDVSIRVSYWDGSRHTLWTSDPVGASPGEVSGDIVFPSGTDHWSFQIAHNASTIYEVELSHSAGGGDSGYTYWVGDLVTIDTGTGVGDYDEVDQKVYAINWVLEEGGTWWPMPELGPVTSDDSARSVGGSLSAPPLSGPAGGGGGSSSAATVPTVKQLLTNKSGGSVARGDVVVVDLANDRAFTTTTVAAETRLVGIALEDIASDAQGYVAMYGYVELVNVTASVTRGDYATTSTTVKKAVSVAAREAGAFLEFITGGTTPSALLFGVPDMGAGSVSDGVGSVNVIVGNGADVITTGVKGFIRMPFDGTFTSWTLMADVSGAIKIDVWKDVYANFPPTDADSITNGHEPEITASGTKAEDTTITDWSGEDFAEGDIVGFNVDSVASVTRVTLEMKYVRT